VIWPLVAVEMWLQRIDEAVSQWNSYHKKLPTISGINPKKYQIKAKKLQFYGK
jgi:hypothetical protein